MAYASAPRVAWGLQEDVVFKKGHAMTNPTQASPVHHESTYEMLVDAEEKERSLIEGIVYLLLVIATAVTIFQFGREPVKFADLDAAQAEHIAATM